LRAGCLTARQELSRQRVGPNWLVRTIQILTTAMVGAAGAAGAAAAAELQATHRRHRWRTRAGGVTGYTVAASVQDWRRRAAVPVEDRSRRTSMEPAAGVMDRQRSGQCSESESRSLRTAGLGQPAGPRCSDWSEERDVGRSRLDRVEGGGGNGKPGRTGRHPRLAVKGVLICAVGALVITPGI
jgi:hypothetical protein